MHLFVVCRHMRLFIRPELAILNSQLWLKPLRSELTKPLCRHATSVTMRSYNLFRCVAEAAVLGMTSFNFLHVCGTGD